jgi:surface protein
MEKMFESCHKLETINFGNKWDTSKVTDMTQMFAN